MSFRSDRKDISPPLRSTPARLHHHLHQIVVQPHVRTPPALVCNKGSRRGSLGGAEVGVGAHGEGNGVLRGQAVAASDASALHVVGGDARGHELVLHVGVAEACVHASYISKTPGVEGAVGRLLSPPLRHKSQRRR